MTPVLVGAFGPLAATLVTFSNVTRLAPEFCASAALLIASLGYGFTGTAQWRTLLTAAVYVAAILHACLVLFAPFDYRRVAVGGPLATIVAIAVFDGRSAGDVGLLVAPFAACFVPVIATRLPCLHAGYLAAAFGAFSVGALAFAAACDPGGVAGVGLGLALWCLAYDSLWS